MIGTTMRIGRQLVLIQVLFGILVALMLATVALAAGAMGRASRQVLTSNAIVQSASDLIYLTTDYLVYPEPLHRQRWDAKYEELMGEAGKLEGRSAEAVSLVRDLRTRADRLRQVFADLSSTVGGTGQSAPDAGALRLAWSRAAVQTLGLMSSGTDIWRIAHDDRDRILRAETILPLSMVGVFVLYFLVACALLMKRALKSIADLQAGADIVGSGDLGHRIAVRRNDEIGDLARAFNRMTEETLGRALERESAVEELRKNRANLESIVEERTQSLAAAKAEAEEANRMKSGFLANMSHELRTPLNSIIGFTEVLQDSLYGSLNDKQREYLGYISTSGRHLLDLINDILDLAKIESGRMDIVLAPFRLRATLDLAVTMLRERALRHSISLDLVVAPEADIEVVSDEHKIRQVLFNFLSNAVKFTPDGGKVRLEAVRSASEEGFVEVSVSDTGIGIKEEDMGRLFKEFAQLDSPLEKRYEGTGLGLALSKRLIESLGGRIWAKSEFRKGSVFGISFPRAPSAPRAPCEDKGRAGKEAASG